MMDLESFETLPLGSKERVNATITTTAANRANEASSSSNCFHSHLDLSLGISLSNGGGRCDATGCSGIKASCGGRQGSGGDKNIPVGCMTSGTTTTTTTTNVLTAKHCHVSDLTTGGGWTTAFLPSLTGFIHPWSLAARQQKAAAEQDRTLTATYVPSDARVIPVPSSAVGWPPVHTSRRNIVTSMHVTKKGGATVAADGLKNTMMAQTSGQKDVAAPMDSTVITTQPPANMFAKVHMEGYTVGRKINLRAHGSYDSLSRVLTKMTTNFFCPADCSSANMGEDLPNSEKFIFLYEDFEGDRMLVGDVPWELFLASAKRLFIVRNPSSSDKGHGEGEGKSQTKPTKN